MMKKIRQSLLTIVAVLAFVDPAAAAAVQKLGPPTREVIGNVPESGATFLLLAIALVGVAALYRKLARVNSRP